MKETSAQDSNTIKKYRKTFSFKSIIAFFPISFEKIFKSIIFNTEQKNASEKTLYQ